MAKQTPMMKQYNSIKESYQNAILFFRLGDFYEMFYEDAKIASKELGITLTTRDKVNKVPMAGVPHHSSDVYISKLIKKGYNVAICEQVTDPNKDQNIVDREVIKVVTPGTLIDDNTLNDKKNNYLVSVYKSKTNTGLSWVDISTGQFFINQFQGDDAKSKLVDQLIKIEPSEIIINKKGCDKPIIKLFTDNFNIYPNKYDDIYYEYKNSYKLLNEHLNLKNFQNNNFNCIKYGVKAAGAILSYLKENQKMSLKNINSINTLFSKKYMELDYVTIKNLEILKTIKDSNKSGSLLSIIDKTLTAMGGRLLRNWLTQPLIMKNDIELRLQAVENYVNDIFLTEDIRSKLKEIYDLERIVGKLTYGNISPRDLISLKNSISKIPEIKFLLKKCYATKLSHLNRCLDNLKDIMDLLSVSINDNPPINIKEGGIIKEGYNENIDYYRKASLEGKNWLITLEEKEKELTKIKNLKIGFNKVFGYYIEVTKSNTNLVPSRYIRKQTLVNSERYITTELKEYEEKILGSEEKLIDLEYRLFNIIKNQVLDNINRILNSAKIISEIDVLTALARVSVDNKYTKPELSNDGKIQIKNGRHPVVEQTLDSLDNNYFVPNNIYLNNEDNQVLIITGPNMAGKSTFMRQVALIVLLAQIGSYVPAEKASITIVDRIFARVGASDDLATGQSTFMVEMNEVSKILKNATKDSLIILDELGRGTSTYDGLSIAWSVIEFIHNKLKSKTLFATHYHELTKLEDKLKRVKNYKVLVKEKNDNIVFLRKIVKGGMDKSYGLYVADLADIPKEIITRANTVLDNLEKNKFHFIKDSNELISTNNISKKTKINNQLDINNLISTKIIKEIKEIDITGMTPIEAINFLNRIKQELDD